MAKQHPSGVTGADMPPDTDAHARSPPPFQPRQVLKNSKGRQRRVVNVNPAGITYERMKPDGQWGTEIRLCTHEKMREWMK